MEWADNFDGSRQEPVVLPAVVPQLLVNGSSGIAVGMATSIPPHNLKEVVEALCYLVDNPGATAKQVSDIIGSVSDVIGSVSDVIGSASDVLGALG